MTDVCPKTLPLKGSNGHCSAGAGGAHDVGATLTVDGDGKIDRVDHTLAHWELSIHALLVLLSSRSPQLMTTDELRRAVEALPEDIYAQWGYYEKWAAAMATILLERGVISAPEFDEELYGDEEIQHTPIFAEGDLVCVRKEDSRLRWRRPHLRCPGYIFGLTGRVEKCMGSFADPYLLAFRGNAPLQPLYVVKFLLRDTAASTAVASLQTGEARAERDERDFDREDCVTAEVCQGWLLRAHTAHAHKDGGCDDDEHAHKKAKHASAHEHAHASHEHAHGQCDAHTHSSHDHEHAHNHTSCDADCDAHSHTHSYTHAPSP